MGRKKVFGSYTLQQAAKYLGISVPTLTKIMANKELTHDSIKKIRTTMHEIRTTEHLVRELLKTTGYDDVDDVIKKLLQIKPDC